MIMRRHTAFPNKWTFLIPPIAQLLAIHVGDGKGWIDPFAGENSPAEWTNDLNPGRPTKYHMLAEDFCKEMQGPFLGVLFDPPYSPRQIQESYNAVGMQAHMRDTQSGFYSRVKDAIAQKIKPGGIALSFGWTSDGFGNYRGFQIEEVHLICHYGHSHDTIVVLEKKIQANLPYE